MRILTTNTFIIKTKYGLKSLTIKNLKTSLFTLQHLLEANEDSFITDSLQVSYVDNFHLMIATTQHEQEDEEANYETSILMMKIYIADV